jgi:hypothetical protein
MNFMFFKRPPYENASRLYYVAPEEAILPWYRDKDAIFAPLSK